LEKHERRQPRSAEADKMQLNLSVTHHINVSLMAWEVRVSAEPDFPKTILKEFQTSDMSAGLTNFSFTNRYISKNPFPHHISRTPRLHRLKVFERGLGKTFFKKSFPQVYLPIQFSQKIHKNTY